MINISNIRIGFATNSSSTHSIIKFKEKESLKHIKGDKSKCWSDFQYGWEDFRLITKSQKTDYFIALLANNFISYDDKPQNIQIVRNILSKLKINKSLKNEDLKDASIDHQSNIQFPKKLSNPDGINIQFIKEFYEFLMDDRVVIFGGSDNGSDPDPILADSRIYKTAKNMTSIFQTFSNYCMCKKDPSGYWSVFNTRNGYKIRFSFNDDLPPFTKSHTPELVDMKITDACNCDCEYCYQSSTPNGKHAQFEIIKYIINNFLKGSAFEIAFGGGDPLLHPEFRNILELCMDSNIVANFSTRNTDWLIPDSHKLYTLLNCVGNIGISINSNEELKIILNKLEEIYKSGIHNIYDKIKFHYIIGIEPFEKYLKILDTINPIYSTSILFLGYKNTGRGINFKPYKFDWLTPIKKHINNRYDIRFGIDTVLAKEIKPEDEIDEKTYTSEEGKFSMYIDAIKEKAGPCSYCDESEMVDLNIPKVNIDNYKNNPVLMDYSDSENEKFNHHMINIYKTF